ncbi:MAG: amidohydrolase family protein [Oscillospiraceae bacterium]|nr:amidohydrolase family protein [Oscillospiraceae bacterium]
MSRFKPEDFEIYDMHTHIFPQKICEKATVNIGKFYDLSMHYAIGESSQLMAAEAQINTKRFLVCSVATVPHQVVSINNFIKAECDVHPEFIGFAALHGDYEDIAGEVDRIIEMGLKGIKLHADFQKTPIDSPSSYKIYEAIEGRLPVLMHMGDYRHDYSHPRMLARVLKDFPNLKVLASHLGGWAAWDEAEAVLHSSENIRFDTCSSISMMSKERAVRLIRHYGTDFCMFGTDFPMWDPKKEAEQLLSLGFTFEEYQKIFSGNAKAFLDI